MKKMQMSLAAFMVLIILVGPIIAQAADAKIRVNATLRTPNISVRIGNMAPGPHYGYTRINIPARKNLRYRINTQDRAIARRLAAYTGEPARELVRLRRYGYHWFEIGRWLHLPRPVVRAAMQERSWRRFLREERFGRDGVRRYKGRR